MMHRPWFDSLGKSTPVHEKFNERVIRFHTGQSGRRDLNPRPLDPQSSALAKLRYAP